MAHPELKRAQFGLVGPSHKLSSHSQSPRPPLAASISNHIFQFGSSVTAVTCCHSRISTDSVPKSNSELAANLGHLRHPLRD